MPTPSEAPPARERRPGSSLEPAPPGDDRERLPGLARDGALEALDAAVGDLLDRSWSEATRRAYRSDWRLFSTWCASFALDPMPAAPETVARFVAAECAPTAARPDGLAPSTLARRLAAIRQAHLAAGHASPTDAPGIARLLRGRRRSWDRPVDRKAPLLDGEIRRAVDAIAPDTRRGLRDRALLLLGFAGAFRRSELVGIDIEHLERRTEGLLVRIPRSKTDPLGAGQTVAIPHVSGSPHCPVRAVEAWREAADLDAGPLFRRFHRGDAVGAGRLSDRSVALVVKAAAAGLSLEPGRFAGHSLRRGFITQAAENGEDPFKIAAQSRHRDLNTVLAYRDDVAAFENHAGRRMLGSRTEP